MAWSSDARLAATRGAGHCSRRTRYPHGCGSYCRTSATRGVDSDSDFQVWEELGWHSSYLANRQTTVDGACVHSLRRVPSHRFSALEPSSLNAKGRDSLHEVHVPDRVRVCTACGTCSTFTGKPPNLSMEPVFREESRTVCVIMKVAPPLLDGRKSVASITLANKRCVQASV